MNYYDIIILTNDSTMTPGLLDKVCSSSLMGADGVTGIHGLSHWANVFRNGMKLCKLTGANERVVKLFSIFHDSQRMNDWTDGGHGSRGALLARALFERGELKIEESEMELLIEACTIHTSCDSHNDITVMTCLDADRLDIGRVGVDIDPDQLLTDAARKILKERNEQIVQQQKRNERSKGRV